MNNNIREFFTLRIYLTLGLGVGHKLSSYYYTARSRPGDKEGGGHPDPQMREQGLISKKKIFSPLGLSLV